MGVTTYLYTIIGFELTFDDISELFKSNPKNGFTEKILEDHDKITILKKGFANKYDVIRIKDLLGDDLVYVCIYHTLYSHGSYGDDYPESQKLNDIESQKKEISDHLATLGIDSDNFGIFFETNEN